MSLPHLSDFPAAYLQLIKGALYESALTRTDPPPTPLPQLPEARWRKISLSANSSLPVELGLELLSPEREEADGSYKRGV